MSRDTPSNTTDRSRASALDRAVPFSTVLEEELQAVGARRAAVHGGERLAGSPQTVSPLGLAFSGGGIRSATFNLGVLQALVEKDLLKYVDYLSTVSGGGYMGSWLHGVMYRGVQGEAAAPPAPNQPSDADRAREQLARAARVLRSGIKQEPEPADKDPITFLRKYSNYLAPRPGLFTADTWTIGVIWFRNVLLNQLILVPAIGALVATTLLIVLFSQRPAATVSASLGLDPAAALVAVVCLLAGIAFMGGELNDITRRSFGSTAEPRRDAGSGGRSNSTIVVALVFSTLLFLGIGHFDVQGFSRFWVIAMFVLLMATIQFAGGYVKCHVRAHGNLFLAVWDVLWMSVLAGALAGGLVTLAWDAMNGRSFTAAWPPYVQFAFGPPLVGACLVVSVMLLVGLMGADYPDAAREWTARTGSTLAMVTVAWLVWFTLAVFGPWLFALAFSASTVSAAVGVIAWIATTGGGVLAGSSSRTENGDGSATGRLLRGLVAVAPTVFLIGYIVAIAAAVHAFVPPAALSPSTAAPNNAPAAGAVVNISAAQDDTVQLRVEPERAAALQRWLQPIADFRLRYPGTLLLARDRQHLALPSPATERWTQLDWLLVVLAATIVAAFIASRRINVNEFSLHHFYKNRLVRCYLGASNTARRQPNRSTGFDPSDDIPIARLRPDADTGSYFGPYPIVNAALNLNAGSELATQERKATSFVFTPRFCGFSTKRVGDDGGDRPSTHVGENSFDENGFRRTETYSYADGPNIGTAVAISGAAANPNWGYHTSGPMAFLLTVFNARLGWWLGNPRWRLASREPGPKFALRYLFSELLGQTTARSQFVNLSDGGHFDNLGLYELVHRRCRYIIVCDAEEDRHLTFGSLGAAIRKCRADFGVEIDIDPEPIRQSAAGGFSKAHCVVGTVIYPEREAAFSAGVTDGIGPADQSHSRGWLLYLKSSLTGDEPADVIEYRSQFPEFPHQSTGDQFFSESQFESYRRLGYHVFRSAFAGVTLTDAVTAAVDSAPTRQKVDTQRLLQTYPLVALFQQLASKWYAPIPVSSETATRLADAYVALMQRIANDKALEQLNRELTGGDPVTATRPKDPTAAEIAAGIDLMQLVQNVYTEFNFESAFNRANPRNSGWMSVFRKWHASPILTDQIWPRIKHDYHALFQDFYEKRLAERGPAAERP